MRINQRQTTQTVTLLLNEQNWDKLRLPVARNLPNLKTFQLQGKTPYALLEDYTRKNGPEGVEPAMKILKVTFLLYFL